MKDYHLDSVCLGKCINKKLQSPYFDLTPKSFLSNFWGSLHILNPVISIYTKLWIVPKESRLPLITLRQPTIIVK